MAQVIRLDSDDATTHHCACGHRFNRDQLIEVNWIEIVRFDDDEQEFDLDDYRTLIEGCCPECRSCCSIENGDVRESDPDQSGTWLCGSCLVKHNTKDEALACCP